MLKAEIFRKLLNLWAIFIPVLYYLLPQSSARSLLLLVTIIIVAIDFIRLHINGVKEGFILFFGSFLRRRELTNLSGATFLLLGCLITAFLFSRPVVIASCSFIIIGDTFAAMFGQNIKSPKIFKKTLVGSLAYFISNLIVVFVLHSLLNVSIWVLLTGAILSTIFEALPLPWDDNFSVPILTGIGMSIIL
jgi:dolichol kinase|uniref:Phosphatidate cytidylyltransferase n=1 Tax=candidate division WOR-3 bacterium TaxID=2052148 RepID=A0A7V3VUM6_UNCW3